LKSFVKKMQVQLKALEAIKDGMNKAKKMAEQKLKKKEVRQPSQSSEEDEEDEADEEDEEDYCKGWPFLNLLYTQEDTTQYLLEIATMTVGMFSVNLVGDISQMSGFAEIVNIIDLLP
jgi:hypothetical protein